MCALSPCPLCPFVGHPKVVRKHIWLFHSNSPTPNSSTTVTTGRLISQRKGEKYRCLKCSFRSSVLFAMEKHVLLTHLEGMLHQFTGRNVNPKHPHSKRYYCKECDTALENLDHMLHHVLLTPAHQLVNLHVKPLINDSRNYNTTTFQSPINSQVLAKTQPLPLLSNRLLVLPSNDQLVSLSVTGAPNSGSLMCAGTNPTLPPQASALVQLASAEAKGLIKPSTTITFQSALPLGAVPATMPLGGVSPVTARLAKSSSTACKHTPLIICAPGQHSPNPKQQPWTQQVLQQPLMVTQKLPLSQTTPQGTMLTTQSLLSHLIPTGNKINGMPTYTLAPLKMAPLVSKETPQNPGIPLQPIKPTSNSLLQAKRWVACPICNELFPSDVYEVHTEVVHKATSETESMAAKAPFLRKMPDKTVKCLMCKVLVSEKGLLEHLLHGLDCMFCPQKFNSIKKLVDHYKLHKPTQKAYCEFIRREYRLYTNNSGKLLFPYFDINTTAPKEMLGDTELNLALVTKSLDLIFLKMLPSSSHSVCSTPMKTIRTRCLFCDENCQTPEKYQQHLRHKHFVDTTIHAILKTAAFKCIYCNGVYTGRVTQRAIAFHLRRCQCAPKQPKITEESRPLVNILPVLLPATTNRQPELLPPATNKQLVVKSSPTLKNNQAPVFYFAQLPKAAVPQAPVTKAPVPQAPVPNPNPISNCEPAQSEAEKLSKLRLEMAWKEAMDANKREREQKFAMRQKLGRERAVAQPTPQPEIQIDPTIQLVLDPSGLEGKSTEERKDYLTKYFHSSPYLTKRESDELSKRLLVTKSEVALLFGNKRTKCMRSINRNTAAVLLGFNMAELSKVKHNLLIPEELEETEEIEEKADFRKYVKVSEKPVESV